jgi:hypothetical protein
MVNLQYGWVQIICPHVHRKGGRNYVQVKCVGCGAVKLVSAENLFSGRTNGCQRCSQPRQIPLWLDRRLTTAKQRCTNPNDRNWKRYGGRGIEFRFPSVAAAGLWVMENLKPDRSGELDRIDNNGHYEPGNLRIASSQLNRRNTRRNKLGLGWTYVPAQWPYERLTVERLLRSGLTREEILARAQKAVDEKRKGWRRIRARLESMIY